MTTQLQTIIPESHHDLLESTALAHVATLGPDGAPQVNPVWFDWDGTFLRIALASGRQKLRNLQRNPMVAVSIVDPTNPGRYLEIRGQVVAFDPDPDQQLVRRIIRKYTGADELPGMSGERIIVAIEPLHTSQLG